MSVAGHSGVLLDACTSWRCMSPLLNMLFVCCVLVFII